MNILKQLWWLFNDRCEKCGGETRSCINGKDECLDCKHIQGSKK